MQRVLISAPRCYIFDAHSQAPVHATGAPVYGEEIHSEEPRGGSLLGDRDKATVFSGHVNLKTLTRTSGHSYD